MKLVVPTYYYDFKCLASDCPDSCCKEWAVQIDEASASYYRMLPGELGDQLRNAMVEENGDTILALTPDHRCPMWRQDGLCRIQAQLGEEGLCQTCRQFPRLRHDYGNFVELGLELSCPEAARLILSAPSHKTIETQMDGGEIPDYDPQAMEILHRSRSSILSFLENPAYSVGESLAVMLMYGYSVQNELDGGDAASLDPDTMLEEARKISASGSVTDILTFFGKLEILTPAWQQRLQCPLGSSWNERHKAIARYFVARYWLQAVSDYDLVGRVKLAVISCLVIKALGGDILNTAQLYSKEIENDIDNIDALLDGAYAAPALTDNKLLGLLLAE